VCARRAIFIWEQKGKSIERWKQPTSSDFERNAPHRETASGHLVGALQNWVKLQNEYESYHFVADWHMLTTGYENTLGLRQDTWEMVADWLACGLDPNKATFFVQSRLPEHAELHLLFSMVTPLSWLERVPTYKEQLEIYGTATSTRTAFWVIRCYRLPIS